MSPYQGNGPLGLALPDAEAIRLLANGYEDDEISRMLKRPVEDVRRSVERICLRWSCRNRVEVAVKWIREVEMEELRLSCERILDQLEKFHYVCNGNGDCLVCDAKREAIEVMARA